MKRRVTKPDQVLLLVTMMKEGRYVVEEGNDNDDEEAGMEKGELRNQLYSQIIDGGTDSIVTTHTSM